MLKRASERLLAGLPGTWAARVDMRRPSTWISRWGGGAFNGQKMRRAAISSILLRHPPAYVIETGTFRGETTAFIAQLVEVPVFTLESNDRYAEFASFRLKRFEGVHVIRGDSGSVLPEVINLAERTQRLTPGYAFYYLDAHWGDQLPLQRELASIAATPDRECLVVVDDFQVPGDPGYGFDDYGSAGTLSETILEGLLPAGWAVWYPTIASQVESGAKRGCAVISSPGLDSWLAEESWLARASRD